MFQQYNFLELKEIIAEKESSRFVHIFDLKEIKGKQRHIDTSYEQYAQICKTLKCYFTENNINNTFCTRYLLLLL